MGQDKLPLPWNKALWAILPGLIATMGLIPADFSGKMFIGLIFLVAFLAAGFWWNQRQLPGWSLMALGMLASVIMMLASGVIGGIAALITGKSADTFVLLINLVILIILGRISLRTQHVPVSVWVCVVVIVLCQLAVRSKYFVLFGVSWSVVGQWLQISLFAALVALLLPVVLGLWVAKRYGLTTLLFTIGMLYGNFQLLIDVNDKVSDQIGGTLGFIVYQALIPLFFTVLAPLCFLRSRSARYRFGGMLTLVALAVMINLLVVGLSYTGELPLMIWISFIPYTISLLSTLVLAYLLYRESKKSPTPPKPDPAVAALPPT